MLCRVCFCVVQDLVDEAVSKGATVTTGGTRNKDHPDGLFFLPTVSQSYTGQKWYAYIIEVCGADVRRGCHQRQPKVRGYACSHCRSFADVRVRSCARVRMLVGHQAHVGITAGDGVRSKYPLAMRGKFETSTFFQSWQNVV